MAFDGERFTRGGATVVVDEGRILGVEPGGFEPPAGCEVRELADATVLPGLIDTHVHLVADSEYGALDRVAGATADELDAIITEGLRRQLAAGVTTVRDLGDRGFNVVERRDRQSPADLEPTIVAAGPPVTTVGGHCHYLRGEVADATAIAAAVAERAERRVDVVKVMASGGFLTPGTDVHRPQFTDEELRLVVDLAHAAGLPVVAHAHALAAVEQALAAGVDGIEHFTCLTERGSEHPDRILERVAEAGIPVSLTAGADFTKMAAQPPPPLLHFLDQHGWTVEQAMAHFRESQERVCRSGVRLVCGTDAGVSAPKPHGILPAAVVQHVALGRSLSLSLAGATSLSADACGLGGSKGRLRAGYDADLLVVSGDLSADPAAVTRPIAVFLRGRAVHVAA